MPLVDPVTMSTTLIKSGPAQQQPAPKAAVPAIPLVNSPLALPASIAHSVLLSGLFYWRFDALVADPVTTLQTGLPVVAAIQAVYLMLSLPQRDLPCHLRSRVPERRRSRQMEGKQSLFLPLLFLYS
ncbi:hypothetical protein NXS19_003937 [Fusarium pseudograminearum]|nr:hypothetical protein NXS19_003937 [Fusarium pseudograminearum]